MQIEARKKERVGLKRERKGKKKEKQKKVNNIFLTELHLIR